MRVANTACVGDGVALDNWIPVIERCVVVAIVAEGIADLFFVGRVTCEVGEEERNFRLVVLSLNGSGKTAGHERDE